MVSEADTRRLVEVRIRADAVRGACPRGYPLAGELGHNAAADVDVADHGEMSVGDEGKVAPWRERNAEGAVKRGARARRVDGSAS